MPGSSDPRERPIAVFDSGVGGLTVLHELLVQLPHEDYLYLGDTARFPYGDRSREELERFSLQIAEELFARGAKLLVVACNSATAAALPSLQARMRQTTLGVDVLGVVRPEAVQAVTATRSGRIGLLATPATVASGAYEAAIHAVDPHVDLVSVPTPELAPIIQAGSPLDDGIVDVVRAAVAAAARGEGRHRHPRLHALPARSARCSSASWAAGCEIVTSGAALARQVEHALGSRGLASQATGEGDYRFLSTGDPEAFRMLGTRFLQLPLGTVEQVHLPIGATA